MKTNVRVISLADHADRRRAFTKNSAGSPIGWSFFDARRDLDPDLSYNPDEAIIASGGPLKPAELGCYSSHYAVWREFLSSSDDQLIVFEDDVLVEWDYLSFLAEKNFESMGVTYLRLCATHLCRFRVICRHFLDFDHDLIQFTGYVWGTQGYLLTRSGAERFMKHCRRITRSLDSEMDRAWDHGVANLAIYPFPLLGLWARPSTIGEARHERVKLPLGLQVRRLSFRAFEKVRRTIGDRHNGRAVRSRIAASIQSL